MAWRITDLVVRGEVDNRNKGRVNGKIWLKGHLEPVILDLEGNPWRDLAGLSFRFVNPNPKRGSLQGFSFLQKGSVGDITASRKVKVPDCTTKELTEHLRSKTPFPYYWGNALYLEWYSILNGRVVIESTAFNLEVSSSPVWLMSPEEEVKQRTGNEEKIIGFVNQLTEIIGKRTESVSGAVQGEFHKTSSRGHCDRLDLTNNQ